MELVLIEAKDLIAADFRGTSDPYVRVNYGNLKKSTKVSILHMRCLLHELNVLRIYNFISIRFYIPMVVMAQ